MPKAKEKVSQSDHVRQWIKAHRSKSQRMPKAIQAGLEEQGIKVSMPTINYVKTRGTHSKTDKTRGKTRRRRVRVASFTIEQLLAAKQLATDIGGFDAAREALAAVESLQ